MILDVIVILLWCKDDWKAAYDIQWLCRLIKEKSNASFSQSQWPAFSISRHLIGFILLLHDSTNMDVNNLVLRSLLQSGPMVSEVVASLTCLRWSFQSTRRSVIMIKQRIGPKTVPWGTQPLRVCHSDTQWRRSDPLALSTKKIPYPLCYDWWDVYIR